MELKLEVLTLPVRDVDAAKALYTSLDFHFDVDYHPRDGFRVVQLTPPGSACSIQFGDGLTDAAPGSARAHYLVVPDIETAHAELVARASRSGTSGTSRRSTPGPGTSLRGRIRTGARTRVWPSSPTRTGTPGPCRRSAADG
jgi:catechol 2,3-dioxygenase-like lactoylglutathione lyase family enzyme